jgi:hydrogenase nickel incorporation protein HypA/HybF
MHEYGIAQEIVSMVKERAEGRQVTVIRLQIGDLSTVFPDSLTMYLELLFQDLQKQPVAVDIVKIPARFHCSCGNEYRGDTIFDPCPQCNGFDRKIIDGQECSIESIEVEDE